MSERLQPEATARIRALREALRSMPSDEQTYPDEWFGREVCGEAIDAVAQGNYGVGCLLVDAAGSVITRAHNEVFAPRFRSDCHAEMLVLDRFEAAHPQVSDMSGYVLHVSMEPCPMCVSRLIISGIGTVRFVAVDRGGGMTRNLGVLPENFRRLAEAQSFAPAKCSPELQEFAQEVFLSNLSELQARLRKRRSMS